MSTKTNIKTEKSNELYKLLSIVYDDLLNIYTGYNIFREWMKTPFIIDDFAYATDAHMLMKVPKKLTNVTKEANKNTRESIKYLFDNIQLPLNIKINVAELEKQINTIPLVNEYSDIDIKGNCNECDGDSTVRWEYKDYREYFDCPKCNGQGRIEEKHRRKTGKKIKNKNHLFKIDGMLFLEKYINNLVKVAKKLDEKEIVIISKMQSSMMVKIKDAEILLISKIPTENDIVVFHYA
nr:MAG: hypothetical protein B6I27_02645 [Erwiniaceae bacterium 4572_131]